MQSLLFIETAKLIEWGGLAIITIMVFSETGFLLGLLIPAGETLIFTSGVLASAGVIDVSLVLLLSILVTAAISGDLTGFYIGRKAGKAIYEKDGKWFIKKKYLEIAEKIILKHKHTSIIFGKFLPVVRPFVPAITGTTDMRVTIFTGLTVISCIVFTGIFSVAGYYLGLQFPGIKNYISWLLPISIIIALVAITIQVRKYRKGEL